MLPSIESGSPAYYHAAPNILKMVDSVQDDFLSSLGVSKVDAIVRFNLAPLNTRRDISLLGVLHKIMLGTAPGPLANLFARPCPNLFAYGFRNGVALHNKQINDYVGHNSPVMLKRSVFCLVYIYNRLSQNAVDCTSVQAFQRNLQNELKDAAG